MTYQLKNAGRYVTYHNAVDTPFIITVPHDGNVRNRCLPRRTRGNKRNDTGTFECAQIMNFGPSHEEEPIGSIVHAGLARSILDYNRKPRGSALAKEWLLPYHLAYHAQVDEQVAQAIVRFGEFILLDVHGYKARQDHPYDVIIGTCGRSTVRTDLDVRFVEHLQSYGFSVHTADKQKERFSGGYTLKRFINHPHGDALQIEIASHIREDNDRAALMVVIRTFFCSILQRNVSEKILPAM